MTRSWLSWTIALALVLATSLIVFFVVLRVRRSSDVLDVPHRSLMMPPIDADLWFQGQGLPLERALLQEGQHATPAGKITILPGVLTALPYKNNEETEEWVRYVNETFRPDPPWRFRPERRMGHYKCMSVSASTVRDWLRLREGATLRSYRSMLHGGTEFGLDPKILDSLYFARAKEDEALFPLTGPDHFDPVAGIPVPYGMRGFAQLLSEPPEHLQAVDASIPDLVYEWRAEDLLPDYSTVEIFRNVVFESPFHDVVQEIGERTRQALEEYGVLYAGIRVRFSASGGVVNQSRVGDVPLPFLTGHAVVMVGWIEQAGALYFVYRETFGEQDITTTHGGPAYRVYPIFGFSEVYGFEKNAVLDGGSTD